MFEVIGEIAQIVRRTLENYPSFKEKFYETYYWSEFPQQKCKITSINDLS